MSEQKIRIGITQGDINGVGLEVIMKSLLDPLIFSMCTPVLFSSQKTTSYHRKTLGFENFSFNPVNDLDSLNTKKANIFNCYTEEVNIELGKTSSVAGKYALMSIEAACDALGNNKIDAIVTAPINKHSIQSDAFQFKGHTDYLSQRFKGEKGVLMLMISELMKVGLVTEHLPLSEVSKYITTELILKKLDILNTTLLEDFGIRKPKIAVLGLNPHAGDNGTIGNEDINVVKPAIEEAYNKGILAFGPYGADGFFGSGNFKNFDAILAMYHDQGLVPFKTLCFNSGVNYTAGLPIIRTSPDHGTAFDIAGKNEASEDSFRKALYLACDVFKQRKIYKEISSNPLTVSSNRE